MVPPMSPVRTTLLLARHGQSTWNAERRWQGQADPPLSAHGRFQARSAVTAIGEVDVIAASPQQRALETAVIISEGLGVGPVVTIDDVRERHVGSWSGLTRDEIELDFPGWIDSGQRPDGWETDEVVATRSERALRDLVAAYRGGTLLVVCHGGVIRAIELAYDISIGRVPNLAGRIMTMHHPSGDYTSTDRFEPGDPIQLLPDDLVSGGEGPRF